MFIPLARITTELCWWISKNPSYVLWPCVAGFIIFLFVVHVLVKIKITSTKNKKYYLHVKTENSQLKENIKILELKKKSIIDELSEYRRLASLLEANINKEKEIALDYKDKYDEALSHNELNNIQLAEKQNIIESLSNQLTQSNSEKSALELQVEGIKHSFALQKNEHYTKLAELEDHIKDQQSIISNLSEELTITKRELATKKGLLTKQKKKEEELHNSIEDLEGVITEKEVLIEEQNSIIKEKEAALTDKYLEIKNNYQRIAELESKTSTKSTIEELEKERDMLIEQLGTANAERDAQSKELLEKKQLSESRGIEIERLTSEIHKANSIIESLDSKVIELSNLLEQLQKKSDDVIDNKTIEDNDTEDNKTNTEEVLTESITYPVFEEEIQSREKGSSPKQFGTAIQDQQSSQTSSIRYRHKQTIHPIEEVDEDVDLPVIDANTGYVKRSILQVVDKERENEPPIDSEEFFNRPLAEIEHIARMLAEAAESGREAFVCACCKTPVKISSSKRGILFFSHTTHNKPCDWKQEHTHLVRATLSDDDANDSIDYNSKYNEMKSLVYKSLTTENSKSKGVTNVEFNKTIKSSYKFMYYRMAGIYAKYDNKDFVFELQTKDVPMNTIVNKDIFYRLHNHNIIWIFCADEGGGYDYINRHAHRNTMFANHRNVFIMDKETMNACKERQELVLKCNFLDPDGQWHFRKETTGNNGVLITLNDLLYDEEMCKPYYFEANSPYFQLHPNEESEYLESIVPRDKLLKDLQDKWEGKIAETRRKQSKEKIELPQVIRTVVDSTPIKEEVPEIIPTGCTNRFFYRHKGKVGIVDSNNNFIIPCEYNDIEMWTDTKFIVRRIDQWGIVDENNAIIADTKFKEIGELIEGKALVRTAIESYYINDRGNRLADGFVKLPNGWVKFRQGDQWGIKDSNDKVIVECIYDEIGSFRGRLIGFYKGNYQKLNARFEYRMTIKCQCINNIDNRARYSINGVQLIENQKETAIEGNLYTDKFINNISFSTNVIYVSNINQKKINEKINHVDQDTDFYNGEIISGTIEKVNGKKYFVRTDDGRITYFTASVLINANKKISQYNIGATVTIKKVGFDVNFERTIWKYVDQE